MRQHGIQIPKEEEKQTPFKIGPGLSFSQGKTSQKEDQKHQGRRKEEMGHHVNVKPFGRRMYLDGPGIPRMEKK